MSKTQPKSAQPTLPHKVWLFFALFTIALGIALFSGSELAGNVNTKNLRGAILSACSGSSLLFPSKGSESLNAWITQYRKDVNQVTEDVLKAAENPTCTLHRTDDVPASLTLLAKKLAPWQNKNPSLSETPAVLLEHLRVYECTLREWNTFSLLTYSDTSSSSAASSAGPPLFPIGKALSRQLQDQARTMNEISIARPALHRTVSYLGSALRLNALTQNMDCLVRTSADLRNVLGLAAETSMCLPRTWNVKQTLQNPAP